ncbi:hypothetical protein BO94DRAFT_214830 [Aspergillus sclerotioniger CBS 115572]|uniref:Uncharacterized protein n=1 Tax=Aspergillus sclerotioniger CBS 115572 TaxID=1450535 RepID=A0A317XB89_9EURO|nr:hypothetical protein BO94DRAFT_214830 [Aspergillus sclerotioniger CBS 115572]PWY94942.1 hypothetical protein BO94DRAFT_214830 [Aspergillus sclerotioniger CBS 115572]
MASLFSNIVQEESQWACITELASQLACVRASDSDSGNAAPVLKPYYTCLLRDPRLYTFSSHLVEALLHNESRIDDCNIRQILSILKREPNRITHALDHSALRCLAYILLNSEVDTGLENGLYLLLDEPQYIRDSGSMIYQVASPQNGDQSRVLHGKLIYKLYGLFSTEEQVIHVRKLAGKLLVEILSESKINYTFLFESQEVDMSGLLSILLYHADTTLQAFATVIFHTLYNSGVSREILWPPDGSKDRGAFFKHLVVYEGSPLQIFHTFVNEVDQSNGTRGHPKRSLRRNLNPRKSFLVRSLYLNETPLLQGMVLTIADEYGIFFMNHGADSSRVCLEFVDVRARDISQPVRTEMDDSKIYRLSWDLSPSNLILKDGRREGLNGQVLSILSSEDPNELLKVIGVFKRSNRGSSRIGPIIRRSSSLVMELDSGEEVARKSFDISHDNFNTQVRSCKSPFSKQKPGNMMDNHPGDNPDKFSMKQQQSHDGGKPLMPIPNLPETRLLKISQVVGHPVGRTEETGGKKEADVRDDTSTTVETYSENKLQRNQSTKRLREPNGRFAPKKQIDRQAKPNPLSSHNTKLQLSNTQESMIVYARHSKRKVYTATSKAKVDWDEGLRPSDDEDNSGRKDTELTSISSPLAGGTCVFSKGLNALGKKRVAKRGRKSATKRQNIQSRPRGKARKQPKRGSAPSPTEEMKAKISNQEPGHNPSADDIQKKLDPGTSHNSLGDNDMQGEDACFDKRCDDAEVDSISADAFQRGDSLMSHSSRDHNESLLLQATQSEHDNTKERLQEAMSEINLNAHRLAITKPVLLVQGLQGRGRAVGNRLTAAFQQGNYSGHSGSEKTRSKQSESQEELKYSEIFISPDRLYSPIKEGAHENSGVTEPTMKDNTSLYGQSLVMTLHRSLTSKLDDNLNTECSTQSPRSSTGSLETDDEEYVEEIQPDRSATSRTPRKCRSEESSSKPCSGSFRAQQDISDFDDLGRESEVKGSSPVNFKKRKIALLSPDYVRTDADTGDHHPGNQAEPTPNVRKDNLYPTKRLKPTPRSTIVDPDGSPRLLSRGKWGYVVDEHKSGGRSHKTSDAEEERFLTNPQSEEGDGGDICAESEHDQPASCRRNAFLSEKDVSMSPHVPKKSEHSEDETRMRGIKAKGAFTFQDRLMACAGKGISKEIQPRNAAQTVLDACFASASENKPNETCNPIPRASPSREQLPTLSSPKFMNLSASADSTAQLTSWQTSLQALHQRAQGMLVATSESRD